MEKEKITQTTLELEKKAEAAVVESDKLKTEMEGIQHKR